MSPSWPDSNIIGACRRDVRLTPCKQQSFDSHPSHHYNVNNNCVCQKQLCNNLSFFTCAMTTPSTLQTICPTVGGNLYSPVTWCLQFIVRNNIHNDIYINYIIRWRGSATGRALDLGCGFKFYSRQRCITTLGKLFTPMYLCHQAL